ncbi:protein phosphatase 2C domain-containing protein [Nocardia cyriacigeorgica]|uniref:protein phosphatase 2C domain-containing protein n=1 Tax=Nocardia cyriacigeorgica TaxID=135487 RepID=UPI002457187A|nr:protein phosphatase 2C domain-containing protein [Nocardia cyriacigeorgica]
MEIRGAELPERSDADRVLRFDSGVIVLDGASSYDRAVPPAARYVDALGSALAHCLDAGAAVPAALAEAIRITAERLGLSRGAAPSSAIAVVQVWPETVEVLVLGDITVVVGSGHGSCELFSDDRMDALALPERTEYRRRLAAGSGYDDTHRALLRGLQRGQRARRNRDHGYWIAEADPVAAAHAVRRSYPRATVEWVVLATDGAHETLAVFDIPWPEIAARSATGLHRLLVRCHDWEADIDPDGRLLPRAKRHDDKAIAVLRP